MADELAHFDDDRILVQGKSGSLSKDIESVQDGSIWRMAVDAKVNRGPTEFDLSVGYCFKYLEDSGSSNDMVVDGSTTAVEFSQGPTNETWIIDRLTLMLEDAGAKPLTKFAAMTALTNGVKISITRSGSEKELISIKNNEDWGHIFADPSHGSFVAFGNGSDYMIGVLDFKDYPVLQSGDKISVTVQDELDAANDLDTFKASIKFRAF